MKNFKQSLRPDDLDGFTLIELLIVIAIIAVLAVIGVAVFRGVTNASRDAQRKADLNSISKAYEVKYTSSGSYPVLAATDFAAGKIPKTPEGNNYPCLIGPESSCTTQATDKVAYCASLGDNQSAPCYSNSSTCYCSSSTQGSSFSGGGSSGGSGSSCDPYGVLTSGLVGYWKLDEGSGASVTDYSSYHNTGTLYNGPTWTAAKFQNGISFDSYDDVVKMPSSTGDELNPANAISVSAWINISGSKSNNYIAAKGWGDNYDLYLNSANKLVFQIINSPSDGATTVSTNALTTGTWHHVVGTYDKQYIRIYVDNQEANTSPTVYTKTIYQSGQAVAIGGIQHMQTAYFGNGFNGIIDDVRIYNRTLSASEITTLYNSGNGCVP